MSDPTAPLADTPASTPTSDTPDVPWQKRYEDIRPEFDKTKQELAAERGVWEDEQAALGRLAEKFPHLFEADDDDDEDVVEPDENERPLTQAEFKAWQAEQAQAAQQQSAAAKFETDLTGFVGSERKLSTQGDAAIRYALNKGDFNGADGPQKLKEAVDGWFAYEDGLKGKPRPRVPHVPANGQAATGVPDFSGMSRVEIDKYMAERAQGMLQQS